MSATLNLEKIEQKLDALTEQHKAALEFRQAFDLAETERKSTEETIATLQEEITQLKEAKKHNEQFFAPGAKPFDPKTGKGFNLARAAMANSTKNWSNAQEEYDVLKECGLLAGMYQKAQGIQVDSTGGFAIPEDMVPGLIEKLQTNTIFNAQNIGIMEMPGVPGTMKFNRIDTATTPAPQASEGDTIAASTMTIKQISLEPKTIAALVKCSNPMLANNQAGANVWIQAQIARDMAILKDQYVLRGTGAAGQMLGILNDPDIGTSSVTDPVVTYDELEAIPLVVANANGIMGNKMAWAASPTMLSKTRFSVSATVDMVRMSHTAAADTALIGYPTYESNNFSAATGAGAIIFGAWDMFVLANFSGLMITSASGRYYEEDQTAFRAIQYMDGAALQPGAFCASV